MMIKSDVYIGMLFAYIEWEHEFHYVSKVTHVRALEIAKLDKRIRLIVINSK